MSDKPIKTSLTYDDLVIAKIVGHALKSVDGLLAVKGGFFTNLKHNLVNSDAVEDGINVEVGKEEVAVDLNVVVEYNKNIPAIATAIHQVILEEVQTSTHLRVVEINIHVVDIKTKEEHEQDSITVQDRIEETASQVGEFTSTQAEKASHALSEGADKTKELLKAGGEKAKELSVDAKEALDKATTHVAETTEAYLAENETTTEKATPSTETVIIEEHTHIFP